MSRVKTFDSSGVGPGGRLFAGDMNSIQDQYADLSNFSQTHDVGTLRIGDTSIQLLKYGAAEARLSGAFRTDGIIRALAGFVPAQYTTAGRPGAGNRPFALVIYNTDLNRLEMNIGSDASPNWVALGLDAPQLPIGAIADYGGATDPSASWLLCDGRAISRTTYATAFTVLGTAFGTGDGSTTFNIPDLRGRIAVGPDAGTGRIPGSSNARGQSGGEEKHTLTTAELAAHSHPSLGLFFAITGNNPQTAAGADFAAINGANTNTDNAGSGTSHNNMQPYQIAHKIVRVL